MKLHSAEFCFENHKVVFIGQMVCVYENAGGRWEMIDEHGNKWVDRGREDDGVMGRAYKPRITDATEILNKTLKKRPVTV